MRTVTENLQEMAEEIRELLEDLLLNHSSIYKANRSRGAVVCMKIGAPYAYQGLDEGGQQIQYELAKEYHHFYELLDILLKGQPKDSLKRLSHSNNVLMQTIEQRGTPCKNTREAFKRAVESLQDQLNLLKRLRDSSDGEATYVPDTNALLYNTALETWTFEETPRFTLILVPTVLSELDDLKIHHRNKSVQQKAETLIRQIKEYRRRGKLAKGVSVLKGKIDIMWIATEPNMKMTPSWLDMENNDDRFLATVIEVIRGRPRSPVIIISRDINLQNKAEFARVPFVEPPEPVCA